MYKRTGTIKLPQGYTLALIIRIKPEEDQPDQLKQIALEYE